MSSFLTRLLHVAHQVTGAERGFAVDATLNVLDRYNLDEANLAEAGFQEFARTWLQRALTDGQTIITNNIITDPTRAPTTNTNFSNLRVVVCVPVRDHGALYLDQHIRFGIISRDAIDKLSDLIFSLQKNQQQDASIETMLALYEKLM